MQRLNVLKLDMKKFQAIEYLKRSRDPTAREWIGKLSLSDFKSIRDCRLLSYFPVAVHHTSFKLFL